MRSAVGFTCMAYVSYMSLCEGKRKRAADAADAGELEAIVKSGCNLLPPVCIYHYIRSACQLVQCKAVVPTEGGIWP